MEFVPLSDQIIMQFLSEMDALLSRTSSVVSNEDPPAIAVLLSEMVGYQVSSGDVLATANYRYALAETKQDKATWKAIQTKADRQNAALGRGITAMQSILRAASFEYRLGFNQT